MRKPNYSMERKDRERAKAAKAMAKLEKRAAKAEEGRQEDAAATADAVDSVEAGGEKPNG